MAEDLRHLAVLYGGPLAGKTAILKWLAKTWSAPIETFAAGSGKDGFHDRGLSLRHPSLGLTVRTMGGAVWYPDSWTDLLVAAATVVLVVDPQRGLLDKTLGCARTVFALTPSRRVALYITKTDLVARSAAEAALADVLREGSARDWPCFFSDVRRQWAPLGGDLVFSPGPLRELEAWLTSLPKSP